MPKMTKSVVVVDWRRGRPRIGQTLSHMLETGLYSDMTFRIGPSRHQFNGHKSILMGRSEVFAVQFHDRWNKLLDTADEGRNTVEIPDVSPSSFKYFLRYLYTDAFSARMSMPEAIDVLKLASMYVIPALLSKCSEFLHSTISINNCVQIYLATAIYNEAPLGKLAFEYIVKNIAKIAAGETLLLMSLDGMLELLKKDELDIDEGDLFKTVLRWSQYHYEDVEVPSSSKNSEDGEDAKCTDSAIEPAFQLRQEALKRMIPLIRFPLMSSDVFAKEVVPSKVLSDEDVINLFLYFNGGKMTEVAKYSTKPRMYKVLQVISPVYSFRCFDKDLRCTYDEIQEYFGTKRTGVLVPQIRFTSDKALMIRGLKIYGPDGYENFQIRSPRVTYDVKFAITDATAPRQYMIGDKVWEKELVVSVILGNFDAHLDTPVKINADQPYWISASVTISDVQVDKPDPDIPMRQRGPKQPLIYGSTGKHVRSLRMTQSGVTMELVRDRNDPTWQHSYLSDEGDYIGIVHSILYSHVDSVVSSNES